MKRLLRLLWKTFAGTWFSNKVRGVVLADPRFPTKFYPYLPEHTSYLVKGQTRPATDSQLPVPPAALTWGYSDKPELYLAIGKTNVSRMNEVLVKAGTSLETCKRILDFGCGSGIMIRWLGDNAKNGEVWGVDISGEHILWCQQNLSPPFRFAATTSFPHLPFEDGYFDLVYAGSVFTHIADLAEAWLLELKRIVRPGGKLYLTIQDEHYINLYLTKEPDGAVSKMLRDHDAQLGFTKGPFDFFTVNRTPGEGSQGQAQVFYNSEYLRRHWGSFLKVVSVTPESYWYQTAFLLEK